MIKDFKQPPLDNVVSTLEKYLELAKEGEIHSFAIAAIGTGAMNYSGAVVNKEPWGLLGSVDALKIQIMIDEKMVNIPDIEEQI